MKQTNHRWGVLLTWMNGEKSFASGEGILPAEYMTRAEAREHANDCRGVNYYRAKAVKVRVTWEVLE